MCDECYIHDISTCMPCVFPCRMKYELDKTRCSWHSPSQAIHKLLCSLVLYCVIQQVVRNVERVIAIELLAACQAIEFLRPLKTTVPLEEVYRVVRSVVRFGLLFDNSFHAHSASS